MRTLSASKLKTFSTCERKYKYAYIDRLPQEKNQFAALGSSIHKAVERGYKNPELLRDRMMLALNSYNEEIAKHEISPDSKAVKDVVHMLEIYDFEKRKPKDLEMEFLLPFPNQAHAICQINGYLDQTFDEGFIDLKSNRNKPRQYMLDNDLQFIIYDWAFAEIYNYEPEMRTWLQLRTGEEFQADVTGKLDLAVREIEKILDAEITGVYDKHIGDWCGYCPFQEPCLGRKY